MKMVSSGRVEGEDVGLQAWAALEWWLEATETPLKPGRIPPDL